MEIKAQELLDALDEMVNQHVERAEKLQEMADAELNVRPNQEAWSALECLQHLNMYGEFYLPEINQQITKNKYPNNPQFKSGWLGDYFARTMMPRVEGMKTMSTFKSKNPKGSSLTKDAIGTFVQQQKEMLKLIASAKSVDLNKIKTGTTLSKMLKFKLGDTFRFVIYHNHRHLKQAEKAIGLY